MNIPDAAVEAVARKLALLDEGDQWPSNVELGGHPLLGTRDDEYRYGMREQATELLTIAAPHLIEVAESSVREQVARDIEEARSQAPAWVTKSHLSTWQAALAHAARIARDEQ